VDKITTSIFTRRSLASVTGLRRSVLQDFLWTILPCRMAPMPAIGTVANWRSGACQVRSVHVNIPFSEVGEFVYHCHILEHKGGGMVAHIRVVPHQ
jgi:hypothetical protein